MNELFSLATMSFATRKQYLEGHKEFHEDLISLAKNLNRSAQENLCLILIALTSISKQQKEEKNPLRLENLEGFIKRIAKRYYKDFYKLYQNSNNTPKDDLCSQYTIQHSPKAGNDLRQALRAFGQLRYELQLTSSQSADFLNIDLKKMVYMSLVQRSRSARTIMYPYLPFDHPIFDARTMEIATSFNTLKEKKRVVDAQLIQAEEFDPHDLHKSRGRSKRESIKFDKKEETPTAYKITRRRIHSAEKKGLTFFPTAVLKATNHHKEDQKHHTQSLAN